MANARKGRLLLLAMPGRFHDRPGFFITAYPRIKPFSRPLAKGHFPGLKKMIHVPAAAKNATTPILRALAESQPTKLRTQAPHLTCQAPHISGKLNAKCDKLNAKCDKLKCDKLDAKCDKLRTQRVKKTPKTLHIRADMQRKRGFFYTSAPTSHFANSATVSPFSAQNVPFSALYSPKTQSETDFLFAPKFGGIGS